VEDSLVFAWNQGLKMEEGIKKFGMDQFKEAWKEGMKEEGKEKVVVVMYAGEERRELGREGRTCLAGFASL
jgi:hypothetical protein